MNDRCDTDPHWFFFTAEGRPYGAIIADIQTNSLVKQTQRDQLCGGWIELRGGNHAASTLDEILSSWPEPRFKSGDGFVFAEPCDVQS